jgi:hypothetical protein
MFRALAKYLADYVAGTGTPLQDGASCAPLIDNQRRLVVVDAGAESSATAENQALEIAALDAINTKIPASPATAGGQTTGNASLASIDGKTPALGQAAMAASSAVVIASNQSPVAVKGTVTAEATLSTSATLPAAGAFEADPTTGSMVAIPAGSRSATIYGTYTRGAAGGQASHKVFVTGGATSAQALGPDGSYNGLNGRASTSASAIGYSFHIDLTGGETKLGIASAEVGVTGTPGTFASTVTFG